MRWISIIVGLIISLCWIVSIPNEPVSDQVVYQILAKRVAEGSGYVNDLGQPTATWAPGYPVYLSLFYRFLGVSPQTAFFANFLCSLALITGVYTLASLMYSKRAGLVAASLVALYPSFILYNTILASEILFSSLLLWSMVFAWLGFNKNSWTWLLLSGVLMGFAVLVRPQALIIPISFFAIGATQGLSWLSSTWRIACIICVMLLTCLPWGMRNQTQLGQFVLVSSNSGINLWIGNHEGATGGYVAPNLQIDQYTSMEEVDSHLGKQAEEWIKEHPVQAAGMMFKKVFITFKNESVAAAWNKIGIKSRFGENGILYFKLLTNIAYFTLLLFSAYFFCYLIKMRQFDWRDGFLFSVLALLLVPILIFHGDDRFHLPMIPYMMIFISKRWYLC